jgi:hypothetical protein
MAAGLAVVTSTALLLAAGGASARQDDKAQEPKGKRGTIARKYKNIKVLGDLPADQLGPIMHAWNDSLGVKCTFCHVEETTSEGKKVMNYEVDTNPLKNIARDMVTLTVTLNKTQKSVANKVTCYTCHQGKPEPVNALPKPAEKK